MIRISSQWFESGLYLLHLQVNYFTIKQMALINVELRIGFVFQ